MMENTIENKSKFFAQYWGQTFVRTSANGKPIKDLGNAVVINYENADKFQRVCFSNQRAVLLKRLSSITDEDAIEVMKIVGETMYIEHNNTEQLKKGIIRMLTEWTGSWLHVGNCLHATDYLRSKGYALPYNGVSVEEQIEYGWIKISI